MPGQCSHIPPSSVPLLPPARGSIAGTRGRRTLCKAGKLERFPAPDGEQWPAGSFLGTDVSPAQQERTRPSGSTNRKGQPPPNPRGPTCKQGSQVDPELWTLNPALQRGRAGTRSLPQVLISPDTEAKAGVTSPLPSPRGPAWTWWLRVSGELLLTSCRDGRRAEESGACVQDRGHLLASIPGLWAASLPAGSSP